MDSKVKQSEEKLRTVMERISDAFVALDKNWCYTYMNKRAGEIFNVDPDDMVGKHIWTEFPEGIDQPFYKAYYKAMTQQEQIYIEEYYKPYDKWFANYIYPSPDGLTIYFNDVTNRKAVEQKLLKAYSEIDVILKSITDGFVVVDRNWIVRYWNKAATDFFAINRKQVIGEGFWEIFSDAIPTRIYLEFTKAMKEKVSVLFEEYYPRVDIWFRFNVYSSEDGLTISFNDITEIKRNERLNILEKETLDLFASNNASLEEILIFLLNGIKNIHPEMICSVLKIKDDKMYTWASPHLPKTFNDEVEGLPIGIGHGSCGTAAYLKEKVEVKDIATHPFWKDYKDIALEHGLKACWSYPIFDSHQNLLGTFGIYYTKPRSLKKAEELTIERVRAILINIIENKLAQYALKAYKNQLELIYNNSNDVIFLISIEDGHQFRFESVNHAFLSSTGLEKNQIEGQCVEAVIPEPSLSLVLVKYRQAIENRHTIFWEETTRYPSGIRAGIVRVSPVFNKNNECTKLLGTVHDITERKKYEEEIKRSNEELKHRNEELRQKNIKLEDIAWVQSHKVRAPLARIMALIDLLKNHDDEMNTHELLTYVLSSAQELDSLISEIIIKTQDL